MPRHHVARFHAIAPTRARTAAGPASTSGRTSPVPTVSARVIPGLRYPMAAPTRFATAAITTATRGVSARLAIEVATAFDVSCSPKVTVNASASPTITH